MKEQVAFLKKQGFKADHVNEDCDINGIRDGVVQYVYASPEMILEHQDWRKLLIDSENIRLNVVGEVHTVVNW
jgi:superfamily II DNA helicase RecQ